VAPGFAVQSTPKGEGCFSGMKAGNSWEWFDPEFMGKAVKVFGKGKGNDRGAGFGSIR
jgi:hypothetical protein